MVILLLSPSRLVIASIFAAMLAILAPLEAEAVECVGHRTYQTAVAEGCSSITGELRIVDTSLTNLDGLSALTDVGSAIKIQNNDALTSIDGLSALTHLGGAIFIQHNDALTSIDGLSALPHLDGSIFIQDNDALTSIDGLSALTHLDGAIYIQYNDALTSIGGLSALTHVENLYIENLNLCQVCVNDLLNRITVSGSHFVSGNNGLCDATDAEFEISLARVTAAGSKPGTIRVRGHVPTGVHGDADVVDAATGLTVTLETGSGVSKAVEFAAGDCRTWSRGPKPGNVVCRKRLGAYDHPELRLTALYSGRVATGSYRLRFKAGGLSREATAGLSAPVTLTISGGGITRVGETASCVAGTRRLECR